MVVKDKNNIYISILIIVEKAIHDLEMLIVNPTVEAIVIHLLEVV